MKIYIASDHRGFELKTSIIEYLKTKEMSVEDLGPFKYDSEDDYPLFAHKTANKVLETKNSFGILVCDTGLGMDITANRHKGIRAALCIDSFFAYRARLHNNANILVLSAEYDKLDFKEIIVTFFHTEHSLEPRHNRRIKEIDQL
jgi:ribose 5-phosphate isomerase B